MTGCLAAHASYLPSALDWVRSSMACIIVHMLAGMIWHMLQACAGLTILGTCLQQRPLIMLTVVFPGLGVTLVPDFIANNFWSANHHSQGLNSFRYLFLLTDGNCCCYLPGLLSRPLHHEMVQSLELEHKAMACSDTFSKAAGPCRCHDQKDWHGLRLNVCPSRSKRESNL